MGIGDWLFGGKPEAPAPGVLLLWGAMITALVVLSLLMPWTLGLLVTGPLLGHATWHAYRGAVEWPPESAEA